MNYPLSGILFETPVNIMELEDRIKDATTHSFTQNSHASIAEPITNIEYFVGLWGVKGSTLTVAGCYKPISLIKNIPI